MFHFFRGITGYLTIEITGPCAEQLLNRAAAQRIALWNLHYRKQRISGCISAADFRALRPVCRGLGLRVHILKKHGLPFLTHRYRRRYGLMLGAALFFAVLIFLSQFIWTVEVSGNSTVSTESILAACEELGIREGMLKSRLLPAVNAQRLLLASPRLSWAALNLEGCVLTVNVSEIHTQPVPEDDGPCDLRAATDGTVTKIDITSGSAAVRVGDTVLKGDVLVSGIVESAQGTEFVRAEGTVTANTRRVLTAEGGFSQTLIQPTGAVKSHSVLTAFWFDVPLYLGEITGDFESEIHVSELSLFGKRLPVSVTTKTCRLTGERTVEYAKEELTALLRREIGEQAKALKIDSYSVFSEQLEEVPGGLRLTQTIDATENIAVKEKILFAAN